MPAIGGNEAIHRGRQATRLPEYTLEPGATRGGGDQRQEEEALNRGDVACWRG